MLLGKGEENSGGRNRASTLADAFEAILGAIYIDGGFEVARDILLTIVEPSIESIQDEPDEKNSKGKLQEILQSIIPESPQYKVIKESGPDHKRKFDVAVSWVNQCLATGSGFNKKEAETDAARNALEAKLWEKITRIQK